MALNYTKFLKKLILFTIAVAVMGTVITYFLPIGFVSPTLPFLYVFFFSVTMLVHYILLKVSLKRPASFINLFMLLTFGKLIFFLSIIIIYSFSFRDDAVPFIIAFFILYLFFTVFEVVQSLAHARERREQESRSA